MHKLIVSGLVSLETFLLVAVPVKVQAQDVATADNPCFAALQAVENTVEQGRDVAVTNIQIQEMSQSYADYPSERPKGLMFAMRGSDVAHVMNSPQLLTDLTTDVVNHCGAVSSMTFAGEHSDWAITYGLIDGQIQQFSCLEAVRGGRSTRWGEHYCL
jgi:hypothetical protein